MIPTLHQYSDIFGYCFLRACQSLHHDIKNKKNLAYASLEKKIPETRIRLEDIYQGSTQAGGGISQIASE